MSGQPRGRGRGRGRGGQNFFQQQQQSQDGDLSMSDARPFVPRGRGRGGYQGGQQQQQRSYDAEEDQAMYDANSSRGRGRGRARGPRGGHYQPPHQRNHQDANREDPAEPNPAEQLMKDFLARRYDASTKLLSLSNIAGDPAILESGMFSTEVKQKKFFPALLIVCERELGTQEAKEEAIQSVSLSNNGLQNTHVVYKLCWQLNHIKNLDLSNNAFDGLDKLQPWKGRFKNLEHLIVDPFPTCGWEEELTSWYPRLKFLNDKQVRGDNNTNGFQVPAQNVQAVATPPISTTPVPSIVVDQEQQQKESMVLLVQRETNLRRDYAVQLLEAAQWNIEQAGVLFTQSQPTLPPEAFN